MKVIIGKTAETQTPAEHVHPFPNRWGLNYFICEHISEEEEEENTVGVKKEVLTHYAFLMFYCTVITLKKCDLLYTLWFVWVLQFTNR